jgi:tetratricopeptide (TPR) repeat protein
VATLALLGLFWLHSGFLKAEATLGRRSFQELARVRQQALQIAAEPVPPTASERAAAAAAARHFGRVERFGLFPWLGLDSAQAWVAWVGGDLAGFRAASSRAIARHDAAYEMLLLTARDAAGRGDLAGLTLAAERAVALDPRRLEAYAGAGILLARSGAPEALPAAASFFERGMVHYPASAVLAYNWGIIHAMQGQPERAIERFRQVLSLEPGHREARENLAGMLAATGRLEEATALYREAIAASPRDAGLHVLLAQAWIAMGRDEAARAELAAALEIEPGQPQASALAAALAGPQPTQ